jgi:hypothetical protein
MKDLPLARRELLKRLGLGAACLPLLRSRHARAAARRHLVLIQLTQGYRQSSWKPPVGALGTLPYTAEPFAPFARDMIFLPGLSIPGAAASGASTYGVMFYGLDTTVSGFYREPTGPTLDQIVGAALPGPGGRRALNLAVMLERPPQSTAPPGSRYCFWTGAGQPVRPIGDPYALYRELFAPGPDTTEVKRLLRRRKSILDYVGTDLAEYGKRVGDPERLVIEGHLQSIRELEGQVQSATASACNPAAPPSPALDLNADPNYPAILELQFKAIAAALRCGVTNVATLQLSDADGERVDLTSFIPVSRRNGTSWRDLGRNAVVGGVDQKRMVDRWFMERIAGLLAQLREPTEDGAPLLDSTVVVIANHMEDGAGGNNQHVPWMLAGKGGGTLDTGKCVDGTGQPITRVMAAICQALGVTQHPYGDALPGLKRV